MSALFFGSVSSPASNAAAGSDSSRSSTWETRRLRVSFNVNSDSNHEIAGTTRVPG